MEIDFNDVYANYEKLSEEEKELVRRVMTGPTREIIGKVFGTKFESYLGMFAKPSGKKKEWSSFYVKLPDHNVGYLIPHPDVATVGPN